MNSEQFCSPTNRIIEIAEIGFNRIYFNHFTSIKAIMPLGRRVAEGVLQELKANQKSLVRKDIKRTGFRKKEDSD